MSVKKGIVIEEKRYKISVDGEDFYIPEGCIPTKEAQLEALANKRVEVLMAGKEILAIRVIDKIRDIKIPPIITCYLLPPDIVFNPEILEKIQPVITKQLLRSGVLQKDVVEQLEAWEKRARR